jgi:hypothetical protein
MRFIGLISALALSAQEPLDQAQFFRTISGLMSPIEDCAFIYEGEHRYVGPADHIVAKLAQTNSFQGSAAFRSDGAAFLDKYTRMIRKTNTELRRDTLALLGDLTEKIARAPDQKKIKPQVTILKRAEPLSFWISGSPFQMLYLWYPRAFGDHPQLGFQFRGYERLNGSRTAQIDANWLPGASEKINGHTYRWFDLERGGHLVKVESIREGRLISRTLIELRQVADERGANLWFPMKSNQEFYAFATEREVTATDAPMYRESIIIVPSSLVINSGLKDDVFKIDSTGGVADTTGLAKLRDEFLHPPPEPKRRTDIKSVQARLDQQLKEADKQSARLVASIDREQVNWLPWAQAAFAGVGVIILAAVGIRRWRAG